MIFQNLWYRTKRLIAKTGMIEAPTPPFYSCAAKHRAKLLTKDYSGGLTFAAACRRYARA